MSDPPQSFGAAQPPAAAVPYAEWWKRLVAIVIDGLIIAVPASIIMRILSIGTFSKASVNCTQSITGINCTTTGGGFGFGRFLVAELFFAILAVAYYTYFNGGEKGQTIGKMAMSIKVVDASGSGSIGYGRAAARYLIVFVLSLPCGIPALIDGLWPLWDPKKQSWHDKVANSLVIDA